MLWFSLGLALLLRHYEGELPWRSVFLAGAGMVGICTGLIVLSTRSLPRRLGWWGPIAGVGSVLARAVWTSGVAFVPFAAYWLWVTALSVMLALGRFVVAAPER